ncbi:MAG: hypothetical protein HQM11_16500 [SAR324 cluster bacterium]|nr:hypothetical protein [SAR324 cluster bacterium]
METLKFWTINCQLIDEDDEFELFVHDIERYMKTRVNDCLLPQQEGEQWLQEFVKGYEQWPERCFHMNRYPLHLYFKIVSRMTMAA